MKNFILLCSFILLTTLLNAQRTSLDFTMQMQNTVQHEVVIYPNPIFEPTFKIQSNTKVDKVELINMLGIVVFTKEILYFSEEVKVNLPDIDKNVYLVKVTFDDKQIVIKKLFYK